MATEAMAATSQGPVLGSVNRNSIDAKRLASRWLCPTSAQFAARIPGSKGSTSIDSPYATRRDATSSAI
jgi:hypothetical protein